LLRANWKPNTARHRAGKTSTPLNTEQPSVSK
jgi:hypothetical protein